MVNGSTREAAVMGWDDGGWGGAQRLLMTLVMLMLWGGLIAPGVWVVRILGTSSTSPSPPGPPPPAFTRHAEEVLAERYARGEIDENEYARRRTLIRQTPR
jgi:putative membrane protein